MISVEFIFFIILLFISLGCFFISHLQFKEKGFCMNNAYIYASKEERNKMNKKPYYRQSAIVFVAIGILFLLIGIEMIIKSRWMFKLEIVLMIFTVFYAVISSIIIGIKYK